MLSFLIWTTVHREADRVAMGNRGVALHREADRVAMGNRGVALHREADRVAMGVLVVDAVLGRRRTPNLVNHVVLMCATYPPRRTGQATGKCLQATNEQAAHAFGGGDHETVVSLVVRSCVVVVVWCVQWRSSDVAAVWCW